MSTNASLVDYRSAAEKVPDDALLGSLVTFSIIAADINLDVAREQLVALGLDTKALRKRLRPVDAFRKATRELERSFKVEDGVQLNLHVVQLGQDDESSRRHVTAQRISTRKGERERVIYDHSAEIVFTRATGEVTFVRRHPPGLDLTEEQEQWLQSGLEALSERYAHWCTHLDSHAVRTYVRDTLSALNAILVKSTGGLYFVRQSHRTTVAALREWVRGQGSEFDTIPLLDLVDQREMLARAFEEEAVAEVERLSGEIDKILSEPDRRVKSTTVEDYLSRYAELSVKAEDTADMLSIRSEIATKQIAAFKKRAMSLMDRVDTGTAA